MQLHVITLLFYILIFVLINLNNTVLTKKKVLNKKHNNHNKNGIQHHKQYLLQHQPRDKHNKRHNGHYKVKFSHRQRKNVNSYLYSAYAYCREGQQPRIIGGHNAKERQFPHAAFLNMTCPSPNGIMECNHICGGSIVSVHHILTAAHCLFTSENSPRRIAPHEIAVRVGVNNLMTPDISIPPIKIRSITMHENFENSKKFNDIAVLRLELPLKFSDLIRPVCINGLHLHYKFPAVPDVVLAGWGHTSQGGPMSYTLKYAKLRIYYFLNCWDYGTNLFESTKFMRFCATFYSYDDGYTCNGDSGNGMLPLSMHKYQDNVLVGILTGGGYIYPNGVVVCGSPQVFVNVTFYAQWINRHTSY